MGRSEGVIYRSGDRGKRKIQKNGPLGMREKIRVIVEKYTEKDL